MTTSRGLQDRIARRLRKAGAPAGRELVTRLQHYLTFLARWNNKINLTAFALTDPNDQAIDRLLVEPIVAAQHFAPSASTLMDVGSGSGSPAIPLLLATPRLRVTMVEAKTRKAVFLLEVLRDLGVDAKVESARFEQLLTRADLHEAFDAMTVRAVKVASPTLMTLQAFLKPGGELFLFQSTVQPHRQDLGLYPLVFRRSLALVESLGSQLVVLRKAVPQQHVWRSRAETIPPR